MGVAIACLPTGNYRVTSKFGWRTLSGKRSFHGGIDIGAKVQGKIGDPIYSVQSGVVRRQKYDATGYGNYLVIEHPQGFCTLYGHLSGYTCSVGQTVAAGQQVAKMGSTGRSTGAHLHFEIRNAPYSKFDSITKQHALRLDPDKYLSNGGVSTPSGGSVIGSELSDYSNADLGSSGIALADNYSYTYEKVTLDASSLSETGNQLFGRQYRIAVFNKYGQGFDLSELHITFDISKSITLDNSTGIINIYNLNIEYENEIITNCNRITIEAGYEGLFGLIYDGDIVQAIRGVENGVDFYLTLVTMDGDRFLNSGFTTINIPKGASKRDVAESLCTQSINATEITALSSAFNGSNYIRSKAVFGRSKQYLSQLASDANANFYMEDNTVKLTAVTDLPEDEIIRLDPTSGLVGSPQQNQQGITFTALLNPRIKLNSLVNIPNSLIIEQQYSDGSAAAYQLDSDNVYRVLKIRYQGDTRGQEWYIIADATSQAGAVPNILADVVQQAGGTIGGNTSTSVLTTGNVSSNDTGSTYNTLSYTGDTSTSASGSGGTENINKAGTARKNYMDYRTITDKESLQYRMQHDGKTFTNAKGLRVRMSNVAPGQLCNLIAMGTYWGYCMSEYIITLSGGLTFRVMLGDIKANRDTDALNKYQKSDGSLIEFIVDTPIMRKANPMTTKMGDVSYAGFKGTVVKVQTVRKVSEKEYKKLYNSYK